MARLNSGTISRRTVETLPVGEQEAVFWDRELSGFGVRIYPSGSKVYLVQTRGGRKVEAGHHRTAWDRVRGAGAAQGGNADCGHQVRRGARPQRRCIGRRTDAHGGGRAVPERARGRALQADHGRSVPPCA